MMYEVFEVGILAILILQIYAINKVEELLQEVGEELNAMRIALTARERQ